MAAIPARPSWDDATGRCWSQGVRPVASPTMERRLGGAVRVTQPGDESLAGGPSRPRRLSTSLLPLPHPLQQLGPHAPRDLAEVAAELLVRQRLVRDVIAHPPRRQ